MTALGMGASTRDVCPAKTRPNGQVWRRARHEGQTGARALCFTDQPCSDLLIIRHGESEWNVERRWQGWLDAPLTALGEKQAAGAGRGAGRFGFSPAVIHCSDLGRARQTAEIIAGVFGAECRPIPVCASGAAATGKATPRRDRRALAGLRDGLAARRVGGRPGRRNRRPCLSPASTPRSRGARRPRPGTGRDPHGVLRLVATRAGASTPP
jgi:hypothetical protein